jgi:UDP-N-acetylglucosamine acyltransferase
MSYIHGKNFKKGKYCIIEDDCLIGDDVELGNYVLLKKGTTIGNNCFIDSYVKSSGSNSIGNDCVIRFNATIARNVYIGNNVFISPNVMTIYLDHNRKKSNKKTVIHNSVFIGTDAIIHAGITICSHAIIGAQAYVKTDIVKIGKYIGTITKKTIDDSYLP